MDLWNSAMGDSLQFQQRNSPALSIQDSPIHSECTLVHKQPQGPWRSTNEHSARWKKKVEYQIYLSIYLSIYGSTAPFLNFGRFSISWSFTQSIGLLELGISPSKGRYLHTGQHKHRINIHRHPCLEWDSNPRQQCLSGRRQFMH
jgi:hypothetical protein